MSAVSWRLVTDPNAFEALAPAWRDLLARSGCDEPFLSPDWLLPWWRTFGPLDGRRGGLLCFEDAGRLVGLAAVSVRRHVYRPGVPFCRVELWGSGEREEDEVCSDYLNVIAEAGREPAVATTFVRALTDWPERWDELVVPRMNGEHPMPRLLVEALTAAGVPAELRQTDAAPYVGLPATWEGYLALLAGEDRYLARRSLRDFEAWAGGTAVVREATTEVELDEGKRALHALHHERWRGDGTFRSSHFLRFHDEAMATLLSRGALRLRWLEVRGEPVAAAYDILWAGREVYYQAGRKLDVPKNVRPGLALLLMAIRRAIEAGCYEFDLLAGPARYKRQVAPSLRPLVELRAARPGWRERARQLMEWGKAVVGSWRGALPGAESGEKIMLRPDSEIGEARKRRI